MIYGAFERYSVKGMPLSVFYGEDWPDFTNDDIFWIHWETIEFGDTKNPISLSERLAAIEAGLIRLKQLGVKIIWTIHNFVPHNSGRDMDSIHTGRRMLFSVVDQIHVHTTYAADLIADTYAVSKDKFLTVAHPSYFDCYEPAQTTLDRRTTLPTSDRRRFVHIGKVQENRGGRFMWGALKALSFRRENWDLEIAGMVARSEQRGQGPVREMENVTFHDRFLPNDEFRDIVASTHVCLAPFHRLLTSGSVNMALTYGLPVIGPDSEPMKSHLPEALHPFLYREGNVRTMMFKMRQMIDMSDEELLHLRQLSMDYAWSIRPECQSLALKNGIGIE